MRSLKKPNELPVADLVALVARIQDILYLDVGDELDAEGHKHYLYTPDKEWDANTTSEIATVLADYSLNPIQDEEDA